MNPDDEHRAACEGLWELFDSRETDAHIEAAAKCATCPVQKRCAADLEVDLRGPLGKFIEGTRAGRLFHDRAGDVTDRVLAAAARQAELRSEGDSWGGCPTSPLACSACNARPGEPCWTKRGEPADFLHVARAAKWCKCGNELETGRKFCFDCRQQRRRDSWLAYDRKRRAETTHCKHGHLLEPNRVCLTCSSIGGLNKAAKDWV